MKLLRSYIQKKNLFSFLYMLVILHLMCDRMSIFVLIHPG